MKKLLVFLFLLSSVSFVGCDKKPETKVEEPVTEAPATVGESNTTKVKDAATTPETVVTPKTGESEKDDKK